MKVLVQSIKAPKPTHYDAEGKPAGWQPMVLEVITLAPTSEKDAMEMLAQADAWAHPGVDERGVLPPPILDLDDPADKKEQ
jgi:hypothetical protein